MLRIVVPLAEGFDEDAGRFVTSKGLTLDLEHSLVSVSKWEAKWKKPFLHSENKTDEETLDYISMMVIGENPRGEFLGNLSPGNIKEITEYINDKMTATWFSHRSKPRKSREIVTSELIYYWMISLGIPFECENWHLNRLLTLIEICNVKNSPKQKMSRSEIIAQQRRLNEERRRQTGSSG